MTWLDFESFPILFNLHIFYILRFNDFFLQKSYFVEKNQVSRYIRSMKKQQILFYIFFELWSKFQKWFFFCKVLLFSSRKDFLSLSLQNFIFQMTFYRFSRRLNRRHFKKYFIYHTIKEFHWNSEWFEKKKNNKKA